MKKLITLVLILTVTLSKTHAADISPVTENIKRSFVKEFTTVKDVSWTWVAERDLYKASFTFEGRELNAYFTKEGEFMGCLRYISKQQMPVIISQQMDKHYSDYVIRTIIESSGKNETNYFITVEGAKSAFMLKATPSGEVSYFKKMKKPS